jgi:tRNA-specific 2-thiouridylase
MSGGVDSSVAALLLKEKGYDVTGLTMCLGIRDAGDGRARCCGGDAVDDARKTCEQLGIAHYVFDYAAEMEDKVIGRFVSEYLRGRTPNPCIDCNEYLKFGSLLEKTRVLGFDYMATGHYALIDRSGGEALMKKPRDRRKDQTYFLYSIGMSALNSVLFPLGALTKEEVRQIARKADLHVAEKPESQDICFVNRKELEAFFLQRGREIKSGPITDRSGKVVGTHKGIVYFTIGQRGGLGLSNPRPLYVVGIDPPRNRIIVGEKEDLRSRGLVAGQLKRLRANWPERARVKIRYRKKEIECRLEEAEGKLRVSFEEEQEAVTPGQSVVLYEDDSVLGGGIIEGAWNGTS